MINDVINYVIRNDYVIHSVVDYVINDVIRSKHIYIINHVIHCEINYVRSNKK